jgi:hypothetical protein
MPSKRECSRPSEFRKQQHIKRRGEEMVKARDIGEGRSQSYIPCPSQQIQKEKDLCKL